MKCDMHVHSCHSFDSDLTLTRIVKLAKRRGLDAVVIANHNCIVPAQEYAAVTGSVQLIPGAEYSTEVGHVLALFLSEPVELYGAMKNDKGIYNHMEILQAVHAQGGVCILAHPFASRRTPTAEVIARFDGVEGYNARAAYDRKGKTNAMAREATGATQLKTAGSDAHLPREVGRAWTELPCPVDSSPQVFLAALRQATLHGRPTSPAASAQSQLIKARKLRRPNLVAHNLLKLGYGLVAALCPRLFGIQLENH